MSERIEYARPRRVESPEGCFFYHTMELPGLGVVHGQWDLRGKFDEYVGGVEVAGKSVLDVGTATGFLSFEAERRGATRVVSFDMSDVRQQTLLPFKDKLYYRDRERWAELYGAEMERWKDAYWLCHRLLGSRAEVFYGSVYEVPPALGRFDVVVVGSVLEHLSDQVSALASNPDYDYTWWTYSLGVYREVLQMLGLRVERVTKGSYYYDYAGRWEERFTIVAVREGG
jgi:SAM-dependent methyltransferase